MRKSITFVTDWSYSEIKLSVGAAKPPMIADHELNSVFNTLVDSATPMEGVAKNTYPLTDLYRLHNHVPIDVIRKLARDITNSEKTNIKAALIYSINEATSVGTMEYISPVLEYQTSLAKETFNAVFFGTQMYYLNNLAKAMKEQDIKPVNFWGSDKPKANDLVIDYHYLIENVCNGLMQGIDEVATANNSTDENVRKQIYESLIHRLVSKLNS